MSIITTNRNIPLNKQSDILKNGDYGSHLTKFQIIHDIKNQTMHELFLKSVEKYPDSPLYGTRNSIDEIFEWMTYKQVYESAVQLANGFQEIGIHPKDFVGIMSKTRAEWMLCERALYTFSAIVIGQYSAQPKSTSLYIAVETELVCMILDNQDDAMYYINNKEKLPNLKYIVLMMEYIDYDVIKTGLDNGVDVIPLKKIQEIGQKNPKPFKYTPNPEDYCYIVYTSGTTGDPKGVIITHKSACMNAITVNESIVKVIEKLDHVVHLSYLPIAHVFEKGVQNALLYSGAKIGFWRGTQEGLLEDIQALNPNILIAPPTILNKFQDKIMAQLPPGSLRRYFFDFAFSRKLSSMESSKSILNNTVWDRLLFNKFNKLLGSNMIVIFSGGAPISSQTSEFVRCAFGCALIDIYGQSEGAGMTVATTSFYEYRSDGTIGPPSYGIEIKLADVPELEYYSKEGKGEICFKQQYPWSGYLKKADKTAEALDDNGYLKTGDIGEMTKDGTLKIIDRKKHVFKLAQGEYIAPERLEKIYESSSFVSQIFVDGDSLKRYPVAIVVPDKDTLITWIKENGRDSETFENVCGDVKVKNLIMQDLKRIAKKESFNGFEFLYNIKLIPDEFTTDNGLLTPTFKKKRKVIRKVYENDLKKLYKTELHAKL